MARSAIHLPNSMSPPSLHRTPSPPPLTETPFNLSSTSANQQFVMYHMNVPSSCLYRNILIAHSESVKNNIRDFS